MPMLILSISKDFDELLEDGGVTAIAPLRELCRIMIMAVHFAFVFVVTILRPKDCRTDRASKMFDVVLVI